MDTPKPYRIIKSHIHDDSMLHVHDEAQEKDRDLIATYKHMAWWIYNNDYSQYKAGLMEKSLFEAKRDGPMARNVNGKNYLECIKRRLRIRFQ